MFIYLNKKKGQSVSDFVITLGVVVGALVAMQTFIGRGLKGRMRDATNYVDNPAGQPNIFTGQQYEPYYLESHFDTSSSSTDTEAVASGGGEVTRGTTETSNRTGNQIIGEAQN